MNNRSWRGTVLFTVILVVMGATVGLKLYGVGQEAVSAPTSISSPSTPTTSSGSTPATSGGSEGESEGGSESESEDGTAQTTPAPAPSAAAPGTSTGSGSTSASATKVVTGSAVQTRYGAVQVQVTFSGSTITAVDALQYPNSSGRDMAINQQALPILQQEVLASQSANIDTVSGATYTSEGYMQSVQSAIDQR
jgi:uncharacterized protein with FMN-binding domain